MYTHSSVSLSLSIYIYTHIEKTTWSCVYRAHVLLKAKRSLGQVGSKTLRFFTEHRGQGGSVLKQHQGRPQTRNYMVLCAKNTYASEVQRLSGVPFCQNVWKTYENTTKNQDSEHGGLIYIYIGRDTERESVTSQIQCRPI